MMYTMIGKDQLDTGTYYLGRGRNGNIGLWDGEAFLVTCLVPRRTLTDDGKITYTGQRAELKREGHFSDDGGCFQPFVAVNEGEVVPYTDERDERPYGEFLQVD